MVKRTESDSVMQRLASLGTTPASWRRSSPTNGDWELGLGAAALGMDRTTPTSVPGAWTRVTSGDRFTCAASSTNAMFCWGTNAQGQLGLGDTDPRSEATEVCFPR